MTLQNAKINFALLKIVASVLCCRTLLPLGAVAEQSLVDPEIALLNDKAKVRMNKIGLTGNKNEEDSYRSRFDRKLFPYLNTYRVGLIKAKYDNLVLKGRTFDANAVYVEGISMFYVHEDASVYRTLVILSGINGLVGMGPKGAPDNFEHMFAYARQKKYNLLLVDPYGHTSSFTALSHEVAKEASAYWNFYETASSYLKALFEDNTFHFKRCAAIVDTYLSYLETINPKQRQVLEVVATSFSGVTLQHMMRHKKYSAIMTRCTFVAPLLIDLYPDYLQMNFNTRINFLFARNDAVLQVGRYILSSTATELNELYSLRKMGFKVTGVRLNTDSHIKLCVFINDDLYNLDRLFNKKTKRL